MAIDTQTEAVVAQLVAAQQAYDAKIAAAAAAAVAPVQAELDATRQTLADNYAAVKAQADAMTADSTAA